MSFDQLLQATAPTFREMFGKDIPVLLNGVPLEPIRAHVDHEIISESPNEAEIGTSVMTLIIDRADFEAMDKTKTYVFVVDGENKKRRGPAMMDGSGDVKIFLTKA